MKTRFCTHQPVEKLLEKASPSLRLKFAELAQLDRLASAAPHDILEAAAVAVALQSCESATCENAKYILREIGSTELSGTAHVLMEAGKLDLGCIGALLNLQIELLGQDGGTRLEARPAELSDGHDGIVVPPKPETTKPETAGPARPAAPAENGDGASGREPLTDSFPRGYFKEMGAEDVFRIADSIIRDKGITSFKELRGVSHALMARVYELEISARLSEVMFELLRRSLAAQVAGGMKAGHRLKGFWATFSDGELVETAARVGAGKTGKIQKIINDFDGGLRNEVEKRKLYPAIREAMARMDSEQATGPEAGGPAQATQFYSPDEVREMDDGFLLETCAAELMFAKGPQPLLSLRDAEPSLYGELTIRNLETALMERLPPCVKGPSAKAETAEAGDAEKEPEAGGAANRSEAAIPKEKWRLKKDEELVSEALRVLRENNESRIAKLKTLRGGLYFEIYHRKIQGKVHERLKEEHESEAAAATGGKAIAPDDGPESKAAAETGGKATAPGDKSECKAADATGDQAAAPYEETEEAIVARAVNLIVSKRLRSFEAIKEHEYGLHSKIQKGKLQERVALGVEAEKADPKNARKKIPFRYTKPKPPRDWKGMGDEALAALAIRTITEAGAADFKSLRQIDCGLEKTIRDRNLRGVVEKGLSDRAQQVSDNAAEAAAAKGGTEAPAQEAKEATAPLPSASTPAKAPAAMKVPEEVEIIKPVPAAPLLPPAPVVAAPAEAPLEHISAGGPGAVTAPPLESGHAPKEAPALRASAPVRQPAAAPQTKMPASGEDMSFIAERTSTPHDGLIVGLRYDLSKLPPDSLHSLKVSLASFLGGGPEAKARLIGDFAGSLGVYGPRLSAAEQEALRYFKKASAADGAGASRNIGNEREELLAGAILKNAGKITSRNDALRNQKLSPRFIAHVVANRRAMAVLFMETHLFRISAGNGQADQEGARKNALISLPIDYRTIGIDLRAFTAYHDRLSTLLGKEGLRCLGVERYVLGMWDSLSDFDQHQLTFKKRRFALAMMHEYGRAIKKAPYKIRQKIAENKEWLETGNGRMRNTSPQGQSVSGSATLEAPMPEEAAPPHPDVQ